MHKDAKGYYAILGLQPSATSALIRAAYRVRAMELHPDRNKEASATREFQLLQQAYECVGNDLSRKVYDRENEPVRGASPSAGPSAEDVDATHRPSASASTASKVEQGPVMCIACGAITAQPRYREFLTVISFIVTSKKNVHRGTYCAKCEAKKAMAATGQSLVFGWWGIYGFFWTLEALAKNLIGAWKFVEHDARLLCRQALYFASIGKIELARAIAVESYGMTLRPQSLSSEQRRKIKLGYEIDDSLRDVREAMNTLITESGAGVKAVQLIRPSQFRQASFLVQIGMMGAACVVIVSIGLAVSTNVRAVQEQREQAEQAQIFLAAARARDVRNRHDQDQRIAQQIEAAKISVKAQQAADLESSRSPLPVSGLYQQLALSARFESAGGLPALRITAPNEASYFIKLTLSTELHPLFTMFVRAGETAEVPVPFGTYQIKMASGSQWYGKRNLFGPDTGYTKIDMPMDFDLQGTQLRGHEITLSKVRDGNLRPVPINADEF